jgi:hypothetical protein
MWGPGEIVLVRLGMDVLIIIITDVRKPVQLLLQQ